jgi:regulator of nucleoside diphosphate kinase
VKEEYMNNGNIVVTELDMKRLEELIETTEEARKLEAKNLEALAEELSNATIVTPNEVQPDVITMNSRFVIHDLDSGEKLTLRLVYPPMANISTGAISVLAPMGTALLGYAKGEIIEWFVPSGKMRIRIEEILYQPEAAGDYHL